MQETQQFAQTESTPAVAVDSKSTTKTFEVILAQQVPAYLTLQVEASSQSEAVHKANRRIEAGEFAVNIDALCYNQGWKIGHPDDIEVKVVWSKELE